MTRFRASYRVLRISGSSVVMLKILFSLEIILSITVPIWGREENKTSSAPIQAAKHEFSFPDQSQLEGPYFKKPVALSIDAMGDVYVVDSRLNQVIVFSRQGTFLRSVGHSGQGPGELLEPVQMCFDERNNLYIYEFGNGRIQVFDQRGRYQRTFKVFKYIQAFRVRNDKIYCACRQIEPSRPLIEIIDMDGRRIGYFGNDDEVGGLSASAQKSADFKKMDISEQGRLWFAWEYFAWLKGYSLDGGEDLKLEISVPRQMKRSSQNLASFRNMPKNALFHSIVHNIRAKSDRLYILTSGENGAEIMRCSFDGKIDLRCQMKPGREAAVYYKDFDLNFERGRLTFYLLQVYPEYRVDVFSLDEAGGAASTTFDRVSGPGVGANRQAISEIREEVFDETLQDRFALWTGLRFGLFLFHVPVGSWGIHLREL